jgi:hypothetical protein
MATHLPGEPSRPRRRVKPSDMRPPDDMRTILPIRRTWLTISPEAGPASSPEF